MASWYAWHPGQAAAGPGLRAALGPGWRGATVRVCHLACLDVTLTDWCACPGGRIIDLDLADFARLASPSRGLIEVGVSW